MDDVIDIICDICDANLALAKDTDGEPQIVKFHCPCGNIVEYDFLGPPMLGSTSTHFFDFIDEDEYRCLKKN